MSDLKIFRESDASKQMAVSEGQMQEYDYNNETEECEWKQITEYWRMPFYKVEKDKEIK